MSYRTKPGTPERQLEKKRKARAKHKKQIRAHRKGSRASR